MLTQLARRRLDAISTEVYEAQFKLKALPSSTTLQLGTYLTSLDDIKDMVKLVCLFVCFLTFFPPLFLWGHEEGVGACPSCIWAKAGYTQLILCEHFGVWCLAQGYLSGSLKVSWNLTCYLNTMFCPHQVLNPRTFVFLAPPLQMSCHRPCLLFIVYFYNTGVLQIQQGKDLFYTGS